VRTDRSHSAKSLLICLCSTQQKVFGWIKLAPSSLQPTDEPKILATGVQGVDDDFEGRAVAYLTTHRDESMLRIPITGEAGSEKREVVMFAEGTMRDPVVVGSDCGDLEGWDGGTGSVTCDGVSKHPLEDGVVNIGRVVRVHLELVDAVWGMIWDAGGCRKGTEGCDESRHGVSSEGNRSRVMGASNWPA